MCSLKREIKFPSRKDALCRLVEIGEVVLKKKILKVCLCMFAICFYLPLEKVVALSFEQTWNPITQECFVPRLVEIGPVVLEKKIKMWKVYRQTDGRTDDGQHVIRKANLSFQLWWAKNKGFHVPNKEIIQYDQAKKKKKSTPENEAKNAKSSIHTCINVSIDHRKFTFLEHFSQKYRTTKFPPSDNTCCWTTMCVKSTNINCCPIYAGTAIYVTTGRVFFTHGILL